MASQLLDCNQCHELFESQEKLDEHRKKHYPYTQDKVQAEIVETTSNTAKPTIIPPQGASSAAPGATINVPEKETTTTTTTKKVNK